MKLDNRVPFGIPQSGIATCIIQLMTELDVSNTGTAIKPSRKQSNALIFLTKNHMSQCTYFENNITDSSLKCRALIFLSRTLYALCIETKKVL